MLTFKKLSLVLSLLNLVSVAHADLKVLQTSVPTPGVNSLQKATLIKPIDPNKTIHFVVWLKLRNNNQLHQLVNDIYDPNSPNYQKFLTNDEFNQQYAPSEAAEDAVLQYFTNLNMQAKIVNDRIEVSAKAKQIEQALKIKMNYYRYQNRTIYSNASAPKLSAEVAPYISSISGLSDMVRFKPHLIELPDHMKPQEPLLHQEINMIWDNFNPAVQPTTTSIGGLSGAHLRTTYNVANVPPINGTPINGAGQTVVITDACGINTVSQIKSDANVYNANNGLPAFTTTNFAIINPNGTPYTTCASHTATGWEAEIALDIEAVHTIAPNANIVLVLSQRPELLGQTLDDVVHNLISHGNTIAGFSNATVVSNSWGEQEGFGFWPIEATFESAAAHGINFNFSSGDCGDGSYSSAACSPLKNEKTVEYPASSAFVTAIGGTSIFVDSTFKYAFETVWGTFYNHAFAFGGGGGISQYFGPISWQSPINFFIAGGYGTVGQFNKRALPDISMVGDPNTGLSIFQGGAWRTVGGTSLSNSLFSGTAALINQARALNNKGPLGLAAPYFYTSNSPLLHAKAINNIHTPHLIISGATNPPPGAPQSAFTIFNITFGWDSSLSVSPESQFWNDAVGIGTPNVPNFVSRMAIL